MKKIIFILIAMLACIGASARTFYKVAANNVPLKSGPGKNYEASYTSGAYGIPIEPAHLSKGEIVYSDEPAQNGYVLVWEFANRFPVWGDGWVSIKYLKKATKCSNCKGEGWFNKVCPQCHGQAYNLCSCKGRGQKICKKCWGKGFK